MISLSQGCRCTGRFIGPARGIRGGAKVVGEWWSCILTRRYCVSEGLGRFFDVLARSN